MTMPNLFVASVVARIFAAFFMWWMSYATPPSTYEGKSPEGNVSRQVRR